MPDAIIPPGLQTLLSQFPPLSPVATAYIEHHLQYRQLRPKEMLQSNGQVAHHIYFIETGLLRSFQCIDDKEQTIWFMQTGQVAISIESFFSQQPSFESIEAISYCELYSLSYSNYNKLCTLCPHFCNTARRYTELYYCMAEMRNRLLRMSDPSQRLQTLEIIFPDLSLRCPLKHIASYLSITPATLSRLRAKKKLIESKK